MKSKNKKAENRMRNRYFYGRLNEGYWFYFTDQGKEKTLGGVNSLIKQEKRNKISWYEAQMKTFTILLPVFKKRLLYWRGQ